MTVEPVPDQTSRAARYTGRLVVMEEPEVVEELNRLAHLAGHSLAAEVRQAIRWWIQGQHV